MAKALHIDAEPLIRIMASKHVIGLGHELLEAPDGGAGLVMFRLHRPDIVLSGLRLPERDGFRVVEQMASGSAETPVLIIAGTWDIADVARCMRLGAWHVLSGRVANAHGIGNVERALLGRARERREAEAGRQDFLSCTLGACKAAASCFRPGRNKQ